MKIVCYDHKHQQIHHELDLGEISEKAKELVMKIIVWLEDEHNLLRGYEALALCDEAVVEYEDGEPEVVLYCK